MIVFTSILTYLTSHGNYTNLAELKIDYLKPPGSIKSIQELCANSDCIYPDVVHTNALYFNTSSLFSEGKDKKKATQTCLTAKCTTEAYRLMQNRNKYVHPCRNFYNYACGSFIARTELYGEDFIDSFYNEMHRKLVQELVDLLSDDLDKSAAPRFQPAKKLFDGCMNINSQYNLGGLPLKTLLNELGGWPVREGNQWNETAFSWDDTICKCRRLGCNINTLINIGSQFLQGKLYVTVGPAVMNMPISRYTDSPSVESYKNILIEAAVLLEKADNATIKKELQESLDFEIKLAACFTTKRKRSDYFHISDLEERLPGIPWLRLLKFILAPHNTVSKNDTIFVEDIDYFKKLSDLLDVTPKRVQGNYLIGRVVINGMKYLSEYYNRLWLKLTDNTNTVKKLICFNVVEDLAPLSMGYLYARKFGIDNEARTKVKEIFNDIRDSLRTILMAAKWLTTETRNKTLILLNSMSANIAYPADLDTTVTDQYYSKLNLSSSTYFQSVLDATALNYEYMIKKPWETDTNVRCSLRLEDSIVKYYRCDNSIELPTSFLQGIVFAANRPAYLNYGFLGFLVSVEMLKGFSDKRGVMALWDGEHVFEQISSCFIRRYSTMSINQLGLWYNGTLARLSNVIDIIAVQLAHRAYKAWTKRNLQEQSLPGFETYTPFQMFWLSIANGLCTKYSNEVLQLILDEGITPAKIRVNGMSTNVQDFSLDYNCILNSEMNPEEKCHAW